MTRTKNSVEIECLRCGVRRRVGFNRINKNKFPPCECGEKVLSKQKIIAVLEKDEIRAKRK